jgi:hypothetical protein
MALLAALVLLALSAAMATATFSAAHAMRRAARTTRARDRVETGVWRAFGEVIIGWTATLDSIPVGSHVDVPLPSEPADAGPPLVRRARVGRVAEGLYAVTVDLRAFTRERPLARRRARLWLERMDMGGPPGDTPAPVTPPVVVTHWAFVDLY